jgi:hypothetical protein
MEEHQPNLQTEILAGIHNQLVDIKKILIETQISRPDASPALKDRLGQLQGSVDYIDASRPGNSPAGPHQQKVIAPDNPNIQPGEGNEAK